MPDCFAIASRIEQINRGCEPQAVIGALFDALYMEEVSIKAYLQALFKAPRVHYRVIVFIVTPHPFSQGNAELSASGAAEFVRKARIHCPKRL